MSRLNLSLRAHGSNITNGFASVLFLMFLSFPSILFAEDSRLESCRKAALRIARSVEKLSAVKTHGIVESPDQTAEMWMEIRGVSIWCERIAAEGRTEKEREQSRVRQLKIAKIAGVDTKSVDSFDGGAVYELRPLQLEARIDHVPTFQTAVEYTAFQPQRWVTFSGQTGYETGYFSNLLGEGEKNVVAERIASTGNYRFTQTFGNSEIPRENRLFDVRWIEVDAETNCVVAYNSAADQSQWDGKMKWNNFDGNWYPSTGEHHWNGKLQVRWSIDEISFDAKKVRTKFAFEESKLPFATRITETVNGDFKKRKIRFVGGEKGQKEHDLRVAAIRIAAQKERQRK